MAVGAVREPPTRTGNGAHGGRFVNRPPEPAMAHMVGTWHAERSVTPKANGCDGFFCIAMLQRPIMAGGAVREPPSMTGNGAHGGGMACRTFRHTQGEPLLTVGQSGRYTHRYYGDCF